MAKSRGRPGANWSGRGAQVTTVPFTWFAGRWRNHWSKRAKRPHSKFGARKPLNGPAMRPNEATPLAMENSVGEPAANLAPNVGNRERECGALPPPIGSLSDCEVGQGP